MSIEDGDNIRFNNAIMDGEAAELRLAAAKLEYERQKLLLKQAEPTISPKAFEPTPVVLKTSLQEKIAKLKEIVSGGLEDGIFGKIVAVLDELEKRPREFNPFAPVFPAPPLPVYPPTVPMTAPQKWPPYTPYVGDPPGGFGGTTCLGMPVQSTLTSRGETDPDIRNAQNLASSPDATGTSAPDDDIPF